MAQTRQLAVIMFTDIVGYTSLMGNDEEKAFELLSKNRSLQKPVIEKYNGRWIKELGDGVMASFNTVSDAIAAAVEIQQSCNSTKAFQLRIGIHLGEVVFEGDDVFGDGVNIASRIQAVAQPGSIWISEAVHHNVLNKNNFETRFIKVQRLKNVHTPLRIYEVVIPGNPPPKTGILDFKSIIKGRGRKKWLPVFVLITLSVIVYFIYNTLAKDRPVTEELTPGKSYEKSIAVLPFLNMSDDKEQEYFSDGLSEELLNRLATIPELKVIGRTSSFSFKGKNEDLRTIAGKLGVDHLLEGSVHKDGKKIRVRAQLINALDGSNLWSATYDRKLENVFELQDEITQAVVEQLKVKLLNDPYANAYGTKNIEAYNLILQGNYFYDKLDKENLEKAVDSYSQALAIDSTNALAWGKLANAVSRQVWQNYIGRDEGQQKIKAAAMRAITLNKNLAIGYLEMGDMYLYQDLNWQEAQRNYQKALSLEPENPDILYSIGGGLYFATGKWEKAITYMKKSIALEPLKPLSYLNLGNILTHAGRGEEGISYFKKALELNPQFQRAHFYIGRNYLLMGKIAEGVAEMKKENQEVFRLFGLALAYHASGQNAEADRLLEELTERPGNEWKYLLAEVYAYRGEKDKAFFWLEKAYREHDGWLVFLKGDPLLKNLVGDPRFDLLLQKMNLH